AYIRNDNSLNPDFFANPGALPPFITQQGGPSQIFRTQWVHTVSSTAVNEMRFSYTNIGFTFSPTSATQAGPLATLPELDFDSDLNGPSGAGLSLGIGQSFPQGRAHRTSQLQDVFTYNHGRHTFQGGIDVTFVSVRDLVPFDSRGSVQYKSGGTFTDAAVPSGGTYSSLANFIDDFTGPAGSMNKVFGNPAVTPNVTMYAPFVIDTFRMRDNLTLTLGLRYEYWGTPANVLQFPTISSNSVLGVPGAVFPNMYGVPEQPDRNNFGPRVGFAYTPHWGGRWLGEDKTVFRGGYGIFYDGLFTNVIDNTASSAPNAFGGSIVGGNNRGAANAQSQLSNIIATPDPMAITDSMVSHLL
ncbi:MAG: TonB-dependent receptor domain-containing protein, partial [Candidatus Acidiferrales bacterium]